MPEQQDIALEALKAAVSALVDQLRGAEPRE
jgi:hypothetical protein